MSKTGTFAATLQRLLEERGLTAYALSMRSGVKKQTLSKLLNQTQGPSWDTVQRLAAALGIECTAFADAVELPDVAPAKPRGRPRKDPAPAPPR